MINRILIATGDEATRFHLNGLLNDLRDRVVGTSLPRWERYAEMVREAQKEEPFQLVIVDQNLRLNAGAAAHDNPYVAIALVKELSAGATPPAILFLSHELRMDEQEELNLCRNCKGVCFSSERFAESFANMVELLSEAYEGENGEHRTADRLAANATDASSAAITIEFDISDPLRPICHTAYHQIPGAAPENALIDLNPDSDRLNRYVEDCEDFEASYFPRGSMREGWFEALQRRGQEAAEIIFNSGEARRELLKALELCRQRPQNLKVRFNIAPEQHPGLYEAVVASSIDDCLMVKATTVRRIDYGNESPSPPTLRWCEKDRLSVLVIESLVGSSDVVEGGKNIELADLHGPASESRIFEGLREAVRSRKPWSLGDKTEASKVNVAIGDVTILRGSDNAEKSLKERIRAELTNPTKQYDIVHYAGHSVCEDGKRPFETSCLIVPTLEEGVAEMIEIDVFASWLARSAVQFVYLSSCKSALGGRGSRAAVAEALARNTIPACLGFRWDIDDDKAVKIAQIFYRSLFCDSLSLDEALTQARQDVYEEHRKATPIWAAPVLFLQSKHWNAQQNSVNRIPIHLV